MSTQRLQCPYCGVNLEVETDWVAKNERVFCGTCCKAFDVQVEEDKSDNYYGDFYD